MGIRHGRTDRPEYESRRWTGLVAILDSSRGAQPVTVVPMNTPTTTPDPELKARHRAMWASGDYPSMVETFLLPLGPRLVEACDLGPGMRVLDVAAGTGNASLPAARRGASVTASDLTPELLEAGRRRAEAAGLGLEWVEADAERLPFEDGSFDAVISSIGAMFAPHHQEVADELVRVCRPGGTIGLLSWTPEGMLGALFRTMGPFVAPPAPGAQPPPLWGSEAHVDELFADRVEFRTVERDVLEVTAFEFPHDYAEHFKARYGPTIAAKANARKTGRQAEFDAALNRFCDDWNRGTPDRARFEMEYLLAVGTRA
jgi:SAM-dependent methyltransferase